LSIILDSDKVFGRGVAEEWQRSGRGVAEEWQEDALPMVEEAPTGLIYVES
jgi:hypothetical protein